MAAPRLVYVVQEDLLGGAPVRVGTAETDEPRPMRRPIVARARKPMAQTTHDAGRARPESKRSIDRRRVLEALTRAGAAGCTRQELADALHRPDEPTLTMPIQTVCWTVAALLEERAIVEPVLDYDNSRRPIHAKREGKKILRLAGSAHPGAAGSEGRTDG